MAPAQRSYKDTKQNRDVLMSNLDIAFQLSRMLQTSLGPRGLDKMITEKDSVIITNDGATIMREINPTNPIAKMLSELATSQEMNAGDGTTTSVLLCGHLCESITSLLSNNIHPAIIRKVMLPLHNLVLEVLKNNDSITSTVDILIIKECFTKDSPIDMNILTSLQKVERLIRTILSSKSVSNFDDTFIPMLLSYFVQRLPYQVTNANSNDKFEIFTKNGKGVEHSTFLPNGLIVNCKFPDRITIPKFNPLEYNKNKMVLDSVESLTEFKTKLYTVTKGKVKALFIQTPILSHSVNPKPWIDSTVTVRSYDQIDAMVQKRNDNFRRLVKTINKLNTELGVNCIFYMRRITQGARDSASIFDEKFVNFLNRKRIFLAEVDRAEFERVCYSFNIRPLVRLVSYTDDIDNFDTSKLKNFVVEIDNVNKIDGKHVLLEINNKNSAGNKTGTFYLTASNKVLLEESKRSVEDAVGVLKLLIQSRVEGKGKLIAGGGVFEMQFAKTLMLVSELLKSKNEDTNDVDLELKIKKELGVENNLRANIFINELMNIDSREIVKISEVISDAFENIVVDLANNAAMDGVDILSQLKMEIKKGKNRIAVNVIKSRISEDLDVEMPFGVQESVVKLATEFVCQLLKTNDVVG